MKEILCLIHAILAQLVLNAAMSPTYNNYARKRLDKLGEEIEDFSEANLSETEKEFIENLHEFCMDIKRES